MYLAFIPPPHLLIVHYVANLTSLIKRSIFIDLLFHPSGYNQYIYTVYLKWRKWAYLCRGTLVPVWSWPIYKFMVLYVLRSKSRVPFFIKILIVFRKQADCVLSCLWSVNSTNRKPLTAWIKLEGDFKVNLMWHDRLN